jgi:ribosomal protein S18 acetylase RimI-like enzyme
VSVEIRRLIAGDEPVLTNVAPDVFDHMIDEAATRTFLADPRHHLVVAIDDEVVVGFVSAVHYVHPDKAVPELWINEVGVALTYRARGIGKAMMRMIFEIGREHGCSEAWVLTDRSNAAAMRLYGTLNGVEAPQDAVMFTFRFSSPSD